MPANVETMAYSRAGGVPWHKLGVALEGVTDSETMRKAAGLDWTVELAPLYAETGRPSLVNGSMSLAEYPGMKAVRRNDKGEFLGVVSDGYTPLQNADAFSWLDALAPDDRLEYETAGSLDGGRRVWALARIPGGARTIAGDEYRAFMLITTGHDGSHAVRIRSVTTRVVCMNTLDAALAEKRGGGLATFSIRHTASLPERMAQASRALAMVSESQRRMAAWLEAAAVTAVKAEELDRLVNRLFGKADERGPRVKINVARFRGVLGGEVARGGATAYSVLQGVTGYADHERVREFSTREGAERRFDTSVIEGQGVTLKAEAFAFLDELVTV